MDSICRDASFMSMRRRIQGLSPEEIKSLSKEEMELPVTMEDFLQALSKIQSSVSPNDIQKFDNWFQEYGSI